MANGWRSMWRRVSLAAMALAGQLGLAGCDDVTVHEPVGAQRISNSDFPYAARNGEIVTEVVGNPFGSSQGFAAAVVEHMQNAHRGPPARFVLTPERGGSAPYRVVMAFNLPRATTADETCAATDHLRTEPPGSKITLLAVFFNGTTALSQASGTVSGTTAADDRKFRSLVRQVTYALIPPFDFKGPG
jgi:hypothetical protein